MTDRRIIYLIFFLSLAVRLIFVSLFPLDAPDTPRYDALAVNIMNIHEYTTGGQYIDVETPPLYPVFMAGVYSMFGHDFGTVRLIQAIISAIIAVCVWWMAKQIFKNKTIAGLAGCLACVHPELVVPCSYILSEILTTFLMVVTMMLIILAAGTKSKTIFFLSGITMGLATLCRPVTLLFPVFFILFFAIFGEQRRQTIVWGLCLLAGMVLVISPWTLRNYMRFKEFIPIGVGGGANLWIGSYQPWDGDYNYKDRTDQLQILKGRSQIEADKKFRQEAIKNIKSDIGGYFRLCIKKTFRFWFLVPGSKEVLKGKEPLKILLYMFHYLLLFFFAIGVHFIFKERNKEQRLYALFILLPILYFTILHTVLFAIPRYRIPVMPLFIIFAAAGMYSIYGIIQGIKR